MGNGITQTDYYFPSMHASEIDGKKWRAVTTEILKRANNSRAASIETRYRSGSFYEDEPGNYL